MFHGRNSNAFTPQGRILQMQYACEASKLGATSFGIRTYDVLILAAEKRPVSPLWVAGALEKIVKLDGHLYCTIAGMKADARSLIDPARISCSNHWFDYNEYMPIESLVDTLSQQTICFGMGTDDDGENGNGRERDRDRDSNASSSSDSNAESDDDNGKLLTTSRPYGVALLLGGVDNDMLQLWHLEPNGEFGQCGIKAIGSASSAAEDWLCRHHKIDMNMSQTMDLALSTMQLIIGGQRLTPDNLDLMVITKGPRCHLLTKKELEMEFVRRQDSGDWH